MPELMRDCRILLLLLAGLLPCSFPAAAIPTGNEVVVVYNQSVPESEKVARHYAEARRVPDDQVIGFTLSTTEEISRSEYNSNLATPLARELEKRDLWLMGTNRWAVEDSSEMRDVRTPVASKIRYVALCYGMPLKIRNEPELEEPGREQVQTELRVNHAAVDSELATLPLPPEATRRFGLLRNTAYTTTNSALLNPTNGILMVTRLDGPTADIAMHLVDKAMEAETNGFWGRAYFDSRSVTDTNYQLGDKWIESACQICRVMGFESYIDTNSTTIPASLPMPQIAFYAGWYEQDPCGPFLADKMEFMPGAFAYHLHSGSGHTIRSTNTAWIGPLLAKGATCTMGSVYEPYLMGTPDIETFAARWLITGFTFGEAAYAAQSGLSWQTTVVGDPLYRPFAMHPRLLQMKLQATKSPLLPWMYLRTVNLNQAYGFPLLQMVNFLESLPLTKQSAILMEKLGDLNDAVGKPSSTVYAYQQALELDPSPQQRIRLMLKLGDALTHQNRLKEASDHWLKMLKEFPDYPGRSEVAAKLARIEAGRPAGAETNPVATAIRDWDSRTSTNSPSR